MSRVTIELNETEIKLAKYIGAERNKLDFAAGLTPHKNSPGWKSGEPDIAYFRSMHQKGYMAELAVARVLNVYPDLSTEPRSGGYDLITPTGTRIDVKWTAGDGHKLLVNLEKDTGNTDVFVLVVGKPPRLTVVGWAYERELMLPQNIVDLGWGKTYALEQEVLRGINTLT